MTKKKKCKEKQEATQQEKWDLYHLEAAYQMYVY